ncbi:MAG: phosphoglycerate kinase [Planctomycetota bacterium]|nr:phosphoglycerate kinase [Planctomycetota bacterium]
MKLDKRGLEALEMTGKRVLMRVDFNVPRDEHGAITDDTRIRAALPTVQAVLAAGGRPILMCHLGRPKGEVVESLRVDAIATHLGELLGAPVTKLDHSAGAEAEAGVAASDGVVLLENVRFHAGETQGDPELGAAYARLGDVFVNDAFGACHRDHASVTGPARHLPAAAGLLLMAEIEAFRRVLDAPARPFAAVLGGAKISDKLPVITNLLQKVDRILIGGGMAYTFVVARGGKVGNSLVQEDQLEMVRGLEAKAEAAGVELLIPTDHVIGDGFSADCNTRVVKGDIPDGWMGLDIGPESQKAYSAALADCATVVWNGPMGVFEWPAFQAGTETVGRAIAACSGYSVVGGGDSVAAAVQFGLVQDMGHISTGGGASLELLEGKQLPGIASLPDA